ncbi:DUF5617 domain-containing protein [Legionella sp. CNM-4043-24]|uniref:DUF5617 domain-containing protein n=1 Tax=Legionella sp. CNM-4043-24 TaxID=3421646 RepID=UPI00403B0F0D
MSGKLTSNDADTGVLNFARTLLNNYAGKLSWWRRLFTGKWNRKNLYDVGQILSTMPGAEKRSDSDEYMRSSWTYPIENSIDLLGRLHRTSLRPQFNRRGTLARYIERIWMRVLSSPELFLLHGTTLRPTDEIKTHHKINILTLAMEHKPQHVDKVFEEIQKLHPEERIGLLQCALIHAMGERYYIKSWALDIPVLTNRKNEVVDSHFLDYLPKILDAIRGLSFEQRKAVLLPGLVRAMYLGRTEAANEILESLFQNCVPPEDSELRWLHKVFSRLDSKNSDGVIRTLDSAIYDGRINPPQRTYSAGSSSQIEVIPTGDHSPFFQRLANEEVKIVQALAAHTGAAHWRKKSRNSYGLNFELAVSKNNPELIKQVTSALNHLADLRTLSFSCRIGSSAVVFRCMDIQAMQLIVAKKATNQALVGNEADRSLRLPQI